MQADLQEVSFEMKDKAAGKAKEVKGRTTGSKVEAARGKARQAAGDVKQRARRTKDAAKGR